LALYVIDIFVFVGLLNRELATTVNVKQTMGQKLGSLLVVLTVTAVARPNLAAPMPKGVAPDNPIREAVAKELPVVAATEPDSVPPSAPPREWHQVDGKYWQINGPRGEDPAITDARENNRGSCQAGMVEVQGKMKQHFLMDELQLQACTKWIDHTWPERCAEYDRDKWLALSKDLPTQNMHVCMDRFEYPNRKGEWPVIMVSWYEARDQCKADGKRLCSEDEWTYACEGDEATPYPTGYSREGAECVNDRPWKKFDDMALMPRGTERAKNELDRLWQGEPSGARPVCKSHAGVYDMTGNVDEWTKSSIAGERPSVLKGGYWGPVRTRCRPATKAHDETHTFYQQGFRCCADPGLALATVK
jgi:sulfatase modifying factor 1